MRPAAMLLTVVALCGCWARESHDQSVCVEPDAGSVCQTADDFAATRDLSCNDSVTVLEGPLFLDAGRYSCCYLVTYDKTFKLCN